MREWVAFKCHRIFVGHIQYKRTTPNLFPWSMYIYVCVCIILIIIINWTLIIIANIHVHVCIIYIYIYVQRFLAFFKFDYCGTRWNISLSPSIFLFLCLCLREYFTWEMEKWRGASVKPTSLQSALDSVRCCFGKSSHLGRFNVIGGAFFCYGGSINESTTVHCCRIDLINLLPKRWLSVLIAPD